LKWYLLRGKKLDSCYLGLEMDMVTTYSIPMRNLFNCGSRARPGGEVTGLPGRNATMAWFFKVNSEGKISYWGWYQDLAQLLHILD